MLYDFDILAVVGGAAECSLRQGWASVTADDNQEYGSGAFLLAGGEVLKLAKK